MLINSNYENFLTAFYSKGFLRVFEFRLAYTLASFLKKQK